MHECTCPLDLDRTPSRSQQKRIAAQKGEPLPTTSERVIKTDLDLPSVYRTEGNFWRVKYFELLHAIRGAHKGIARLRRRVVALQQWSEEISERYLQEKNRFNDELMEANYKADQRQMENDHLRRQLEDITSQRDGACKDVNRLRDRVEAIDEWTPVSAKVCPLCKYEEGKFISACNYHNEINRLQAQMAIAVLDNNRLMVEVQKLEATLELMQQETKK